MLSIVNKITDQKRDILNKTTWIVMYFLLAQSLISGDALLRNIAVIVSIIYSLVSKIENIFPLLCGLTMFESVFSISGDNMLFVLLVIIVFKIIAKDGIKNTFAFIGCLAVCCLEFSLDLSNPSLGQIIVNITCIIFVFVSFSNVQRLNVRVYDVILALMFSFACIVYYVLSMEGGISEFISSFMSNTYAYRFGEAYGDTVGGAMAIPLYAAMIISCAISFLILNKNLKKGQIVFAVVAALFALIFGAITVSRSFYLCLGVLLITVFLFRSRSRRGLIVKIVIPAIIAVFVAFAILVKPDMLNKLVESLQLRLDSGIDTGSGGRFDIWLASISYLVNNPLKLLFGSGATNYLLIGTAQNELFLKGTHNLLLDLIMSWGIVGTFFVLAVCFTALKGAIKIKKPFNKHSLIPLVVYLMFSMTALRCCNMKTWVFLLIAYVFIVQLNKGENYDT